MLRSSVLEIPLKAKSLQAPSRLGGNPCMVVDFKRFQIVIIFIILSMYCTDYSKTLGTISNPTPCAFVCTKVLLVTIAPCRGTVEPKWSKWPLPTTTFGVFDHGWCGNDGGVIRVPEPSNRLFAVTKAVACTNRGA